MTPVTAPADAAAETRHWRTPPSIPWWRIPLYPAALSSALVVMVWGHAGLATSMLIRPLAVAVATGLGLTLLFAALLRDRDRGAMLASVLILIAIATDDRMALVLVIGAVVILVDGLMRRGRPTLVARTSTRILSGIGLILVIALTIDLIQFGAIGSAAAELTKPPLPPLGVTAAGQPDMYLFLLDAYPGDRAAARSATFDRDAFPDALTARGFEVVRDSHSNYLQTPLTLASMLSMRHLIDIPELGPPYGPVMADWRRLRGVLDDAAAFAILRDAGYEVTVLDAGYGHAQLRRVDHFVESIGPEELESVLLESTRLERLIETVVPTLSADAARTRVKDTYRSVAAIAAEPHATPRFIFVHVPAPHPPWVFNADGSPRTPTQVTFGGEPGLSYQEARDAGFAQATYIARLTEEAVDGIVAASGRPPVIVVMSDHGPGDGFDPEAPAHVGPRGPGQQLHGRARPRTSRPDGQPPDTRQPVPDAPRRLPREGQPAPAGLHLGVPRFLHRLGRGATDRGLDPMTSARRPCSGARPRGAVRGRPRSRLPIAVYPAALAVALVAELVNVGGVSPFSAVRGWIIVIGLGLLLSAIGRLLLGDKDRGGVLAAVWVMALLGGDDPAFLFVMVAATAVFLLERYGLRTERRTIRWWFDRPLGEPDRRRDRPGHADPVRADGDARGRRAIADS